MGEQISREARLAALGRENMTAAGAEQLANIMAEEQRKEEEEKIKKRAKAMQEKIDKALGRAAVADKTNSR